MTRQKQLFLIQSALLPLLLASACGGDATMPPAELLAAPAAGQGIQLRMAGSIEAGQETERCQFFTVPPGGLNVNKEAIRYLGSSHHVLVYTTPYTSIPTTDINDVVRDGGQLHDCPLGPTSLWRVSGVMAAAQSPDAEPIIDLPAGVAFRVPEGSVVLMNVHYVNATSQKVETDTRVNLYSVAASEVKQDAGLIFFYDPFIRVPALGKASARMRCPVTKDVTLLNVQSHMHRRGVGYVADLTDASGAKLEQLYTNTEWENVPMQRWADGAKVLKAGTALDYRCDYSNPEDRVVKQGPTSHDEMCMLLGAYYPRDASFEVCSEAGTRLPSTAATWIGSGTMSCADAVQCVGGVKDEAGFYGCVVDTCPGVATETSALLKCRFRSISPGGACESRCAAGGTDCNNCILEKCQTEFGACFNAKC